MATRLGMTLKRLRIKAGLTQDGLARKAGVTYAYISMLESGAKKNPSLVLVKKLAKALGVSVADLLE
jgi:transcriptional regulator with XRE-family HTH domain